MQLQIEHLDQKKHLLGTSLNTVENYSDLIAKMGNDFDFKANILSHDSILFHESGQH